MWRDQRLNFSFDYSQRDKELGLEPCVTVGVRDKGCTTKTRISRRDRRLNFSFDYSSRDEKLDCKQRVKARVRNEGCATKKSQLKGRESRAENDGQTFDFLLFLYTMKNCAARSV